MTYPIIGSYPLQIQVQKTDRPIHVYIIRDPDSGRVRYVGRCVDPARRASQHRSNPCSNETWKWLKRLFRENKWPALEVVEIVSSAAGKEAERRWIYRLLDEGEPLLNRLHRKSWERQGMIGR